MDEACYTMNRDSLRIRLEGDNTTVIFWYEGFRVFSSGLGTWAIQKYTSY
jgi:hypothetical protein